MARAPRIEYAGAVYHVVNRGNHLERIFRGNSDRAIFLKTLEESCRSSGWVVHSFVLMKNHYHLLVETQRPTLVKGMQYLDSTYTLRYNVRHKARGRLFQGRYKALLVESEGDYFLTASDYIHMNPVRAKRGLTLKDWFQDPWSSIGWLIGIRPKRPAWLRWERVFGELGLKNESQRSRNAFRDYLTRHFHEEQRDNPRWDALRRGWCAGSVGFVEEMKKKLKELAEKPRKRESWADEAVEEMEEDRAERLLKRGLKKLGLSRLNQLKGVERYLLARWLRRESMVSVRYLADRLGLKSRGGMSGSLWVVSEKMKSDAILQKKWNTLIKEN